MNDVIVIGGIKGGVGKSFITMGVVDVLRQLGNKVFVVDGDCTTDIFKVFNRTEIECVVCPFNSEDDAICLGGLVEKHPNAYVVINTAAGCRLWENIGVLIDVCKQTNRNFLTFWPIGKDNYSLSAASDYLKSCEGTPLFVVVNTYFGDSEDFETYHTSELKKSVETIVYPVLPRVVANKMNWNRLNYGNATTERDENGELFLTIAESSALSHFRKKVKSALFDVFESIKEV